MTNTCKKQKISSMNKTRKNYANLKGVAVLIPNKINVNGNVIFKQYNKGLRINPNKRKLIGFIIT